MKEQQKVRHLALQMTWWRTDPCIVALWLLDLFNKVKQTNPSPFFKLQHFGVFCHSSLSYTLTKKKTKGEEGSCWKGKRAWESRKEKERCVNAVEEALD